MWGESKIETVQLCHQLWLLKSILLLCRVAAFSLCCKFALSVNLIKIQIVYKTIPVHTLVIFFTD